MSNKRQQVDEYNYQYWLEKNTKNQRRALPNRNKNGIALTTRAQVALALTSAMLSADHYR